MECLERRTGRRAPKRGKVFMTGPVWRSLLVVSVSLLSATTLILGQDDAQEQSQVIGELEKLGASVIIDKNPGRPITIHWLPKTAVPDEK